METTMSATGRCDCETCCLQGSHARQDHAGGESPQRGGLVQAPALYIIPRRASRPLSSSPHAVQLSIRIDRWPTSSADRRAVGSEPDGDDSFGEALPPKALASLKARDDCRRSPDRDYYVVGDRADRDYTKIGTSLALKTPSHW
ncbi:hypothetical protein DOTSEDRAFT_38625 [Dothistroma septosporum NZE10]|uniref:Uncharacterized protein n=1 Tax=Dothistroma septosporum (strain NZE10 / CBS 128990) TaxID=675120 RepID=M2YKN3_DOTSN|nr:hypothetical protein DOTSEDRAFT_38625 [Dothistroma septosporum NZE10]